MIMSTWIDQFSYAEKLAALTQLYLELRLPLAHALRAAEADLSQRENRVRLFEPVQFREVLSQSSVSRSK
jgi:hypothetical protein